MKRSEILKRFENWIHNDMDVGDDHFIYYSRFQSDILQFFEDQGMLPPSNRSAIEKKIVDEYPNLFEYDHYHRCMKYKQGHWKVNNAPKDIMGYIKTRNYGQYSIAYLDVGDHHRWEDEL